MAEVPLENPIAERRMTAFQLIVMLLCCVINVSDGFETVAMAYAAPTVGQEWQISAQMLGVIFSATGFGMLTGAFLLAPLADRFGRRTILLSALAVMFVVMVATSAATSVPMLIICRFLTGLGLGCVLPNLNVIIVEYGNKKWGNIFISLMHIGFSVGLVLGSLIAVLAIPQFGWRSIFISAAILNFILVIAAFRYLPESLDFLAAARPADALSRTNKIRRKLGLEPVDSMPAVELRPRESRSRVREIVQGERLVPTMMLWIASFVYALVNFYQLNWTPKVLALAGLSTSTSILSGIATGGGAALGCIMLGILSAYYRTSWMTAGAFALGAISLWVFGSLAYGPFGFLLTAGTANFFLLAGFSGLMIVATRYYPAGIRSTGISFVVGFGRVGAVVGPYAGGLMMQQNWPRAQTYSIFAATLLLGAISMLVVHLQATRRSEEHIKRMPRRIFVGEGGRDLR